MDYYIYKNDKNIGPLPEGEVINGLRSGRYVSSDLGCRVGETEWRDLSFLFPLERAALAVLPLQPTYQQPIQPPVYRQPQQGIYQPMPSYQPAPNNTGSNSDVSRMLMYQANQKSAGTAFVLWFFLGFFGAHRFYCGKTGTGLVYLGIALVTVFLGIITFFISGAGAFLTAWILWIWQLVDVFLITGWIRQHNTNLAAGVSNIH